MSIAARVMRAVTEGKHTLAEIRGALGEAIPPYEIYTAIANLKRRNKIISTGHGRYESLIG